MAPVAPIGRQGAIERVARGGLPVSFGSPHPRVMVLAQDGVFRIRALVIDPAEARVEMERARAAGRPWMPEHHSALGRPTGEIFAEAPTLEGLLEHMRAMPWPPDW